MGEGGERRREGEEKRKRGGGEERGAGEGEGMDEAGRIELGNLLAYTGSQWHKNINSMCILHPSK